LGHCTVPNRIWGVSGRARVLLRQGSLAWRLCGLHRMRRRRLPGRGQGFPLSLSLSTSLLSALARTCLWDGFVEKERKREERFLSPILSPSATAADVSAAIKSGFWRGRSDLPKRKSTIPIQVLFKCCYLLLQRKRERSGFSLLFSARRPRGGRTRFKQGLVHFYCLRRGSIQSTACSRLPGDAANGLRRGLLGGGCRVPRVVQDVRRVVRSVAMVVVQFAEGFVGLRIATVGGLWTGGRASITARRAGGRFAARFATYMALAEVCGGGVSGGQAEAGVVYSKPIL
jgi:hypothetical protein